MSTPDDLQKIVDDHCATLLEHFDSVTILVTSHNGGAAETAGFDGGGGNYYARIGKAQEWLLMQEQHVINWTTKKSGKAK